MAAANFGTAFMEGYRRELGVEEGQPIPCSTVTAIAIGTLGCMAVFGLSIAAASGALNGMTIGSCLLGSVGIGAISKLVLDYNKGLRGKKLAQSIAANLVMSTYAAVFGALAVGGVVSAVTAGWAILIPGIAGGGLRLLGAGCAGCFYGCSRLASR